MKYQIGQSVQYNYSADYVRTGEVVEYDESTNRYRVYWHTEINVSRPESTWVGHPNKRTWVKADALREAK